MWRDADNSVAELLHEGHCNSCNEKALDWLEAIVVVAFHVEHGQIIEDVYSVNGTLSEAAKRKICSLSLPDSNSGQNGDVQFIFRYRNSAAPLHVTAPLDEHYSYCSAFFRQIKDSSLRRGYFQKSIVLVSNNPCTPFLEECSFIVGPLFFEFGKSVLEAMLQDIKLWPAPIPAHSFRLPIAGCTMNVTMPFTLQDPDPLDDLEAGSSNNSSSSSTTSPISQYHRCLKPQRSFVWESSGEGHLLKKQEIRYRVADGGKTGNSSRRKNCSSSGATGEDDYSSSGSLTDDLCSDGEGDNVIPTNVFTAQNGLIPGLFQEVPLFTTFGGLSIALWHIWELTLAGDPILVLAPTPDRCSQAVLAIASLISPIQFACDYRPYFTIYDSDFMEISRKHDELRGQGLPPCVLGVTNPYFLKSLEYWPNVISMGGAGPSTTALARSLTPPLKSDLPVSVNTRLCSNSEEEDTKTTVGARSPTSPPRLIFEHRNNSAGGVVGGAEGGRNQQQQRPSSRSKLANEAYERVIKSSKRTLNCSANSSLHTLAGAESLSVEGRDIKSARYIPTVAKRGESLRALLSDQKYERSIILTRDEPLVPPDKHVLRQLLPEHDTAKANVVLGAHSAEPPALAINNALLRLHFQNLTKAFLRPLEAFLRLEAVGSRAAQNGQGISVSAYDEEPTLLSETFNEKLFFAELKNNVPKELRKADWKKLYKKFLHGQNFKPWYDNQRVKLEAQLQRIYRHLRLSTDPDVLLQAAGADKKMRTRILSGRNPPSAGAACLPSDKTKASKVFHRVKRALDKELAKHESEQDRVLVAKIQEHLTAVQTLLCSSPT